MLRLFTTIDNPTVIQVLQQEIPAITVSSIRFYKARSDRCVAEVNDHYILKFPLCEEALQGMLHEWYVVNTLHGHMSVSVPAPVFIAQSGRCFAYRKIPGVVLTDNYYRTLSIRQRQDFAASIACFLSELHETFPVSEAAIAGLRFPDDPLSAKQLRQRFLPLLHEHEQILSLYEEIEQACGVPVVLHGDLHGWNIVLHPTSNQLAGIFDFNGACIGDRHLDFRYFFCLDPSLHNAIMAQYQQLSGSVLSTPRSVLYGAATDLSDLVYCTEENMPIVDGPIPNRVAHLLQVMKMYRLL